MRRALKDAVAKAASLPEADQDKIGRELSAHVEKVRALRRDLEAGLRSLDAGRGKQVDVVDAIRRARARHGKD